LKVLMVLKREIPSRLLGKRYSNTLNSFDSKREVILSEWLKGNKS